jgi:two-component system sensor histidine kinase KdpD
VSARVEPGLPLLRCDAVLIVQLLDNLVDNALKHGANAEDEATAEIVARRLGEQLVLAVKDRGPGVPAAERERIFEPFARGEAHRERGAGVGLALCRAIAEAHGGTLRCRARGHGGASFECVLPLAPQAPTA